ncbi:MAG: valine--tRNA ligase [Peptostreptococcaceae bacterium]|jgi:valyl-tRNA synthetase|nr:valine--tRNA ligase [Peptostreptococcaceae bacterium]
MSNEMAKTYNPKDFEQRIYESWEEKKSFEPKGEGKPYSIMLPPPNITGKLHMGHALDHTLQDVLIRYNRMLQKNTLWQPGTDHASIATEVKVVEKILKEENLTKYDLGRDEFLKRAWDWRDEYGRTIVNQMKKLGDSCDWSKERFTMDEGCNEAVTEFFIKLYEDGHIYRGNRIINWCPDCKTSLSDAEVEHEEHDGKFYHFKYFIKDSNEFVEIATTRPETILGDTAVAVNPEDDRYKHLIGKKLILPIVNREIEIVADEYVEMDFGTGAVKITPAHDPNDFEIGQRHNLEQIVVMNEDGTMNEKALKYEGMDRYECRKQLVKDFDEAGFLVKIKDHNHNVGHCYRCNTIIEPRLSEQWFVKMDELAKPAIEIVKNKKMQFVPQRYEKIYFHWLENIRDWCISRQLWWGHRIPAYHCKDCNNIMVQKDEALKCNKCDSTNIAQDEDVLDTWFSSALWPFSTLGWPNETASLKEFYPTSTLVTGYDIIFFWVVRMAVAGMYCMEEIPFDHVLIHGLVRDSEGRKMSKSLGNGVDPLEVIEEYGADALRFMLITGNTPGNDMRFYMERVESSRNFANKLWNASRFVLMNMDNDLLSNITKEEAISNMNLADKWILSRLNTVIDEINHNIEKFELGIAGQKINDFTWSNFCDWYIELAKPRLYSEDKLQKQTALYVLNEVLTSIVKLLHPFMPFITEEINNFLPNKEEQIITSIWPKSKDEFNFKKEEEMMELIMDAIKSIRNIRSEMDVKPSKKAKVILVPNEDKKEVCDYSKDFLKTLAYASEVFIEDNKDNIADDAVSTVVDGIEIFMPLEELVDFDKEIQRLKKEEKKLQGEVKRASSKLSNEGFVSKAPQKLIDSEKEKLAKYEEMLKTVSERIQELNNKLK